MSDKKRLDLYLVEKGYFLTRSRARDAIQRGAVKVAGQSIKKASYAIKKDEQVIIEDAARFYVARSALKLVAALDHFSLDVTARSAIDIGASMGGFCQVLLERGVEHIVAIEVGHDQMDSQLRSHPRIELYEGVNARYLRHENIGWRKINLIVCDVSFISLTLVLPNILNFAERGSYAILLVKPQFEIGLETNFSKKAFTKNGILKDKSLGQKIAYTLQDWLNNFPGWQAKSLMPSPLKGGDGNQEYLLFGEKIT